MKAKRQEEQIVTDERGRQRFHGKKTEYFLFHENLFIYF